MFRTVNIQNMLRSTLRLLHRFCDFNRSSDLFYMLKVALKHYNNSDYDKAIKIYKKVINSTSADNDCYFVALIKLGECYLCIAEFEQAFLTLKNAENICPQTLDYMGIINLRLGNFFLIKDDYKEAERYYLAVHEKLAIIGESNYFYELKMGLYNLYYKMGQYELALTFLEEAVNVIPSEFQSISAVSDILCVRAELLCKHRQIDEALLCTKKALSLFNNRWKKKVEFADVLCTHGVVLYNLGEWTEMIGDFQTAKKIYEKKLGQNCTQVDQCLFYIGSAYVFLENYEKAEKYLLLCAKSHENKNLKISIDYITILQSLALGYLRQDKKAECEATLIQYMNLYLDIVNQSYKSTDVQERVNLMQELYRKQLQIYYTIFLKLITTNEFLCKCFEFRLRLKWTILESIINKENREIKFENIQKSIGQEEALIEIVRFYEWDSNLNCNFRYMFFIITSENKNAPFIVREENGNDLDGLFFNDYINSIKSKSIDFNSFERYWGKIDKIVGGKKRIYISPDGIYRRININSLLTPEGDFYGSQREIILNHNLCNFLTFDPILKNKISKSILVGYSDQSERYCALPYCQKEIKKIESILSDAGWITVSYINEKIHFQSIINLEQFHILHIATHSYFFEEFHDDALISELLNGISLVLNESNLNAINSGISEDSTFSAKDILELDCYTIDLVVLSACNTGVEHQLNSGESFGFARSFFHKGVRFILMTLWEVEDKTTEEFMCLFYTYLTKTNDVVESFNHTQKEIKEKYRHPLYWGGFVLYCK